MNLAQIILPNLIILPLFRNNKESKEIVDSIIKAPSDMEILDIPRIPFFKPYIPYKGLREIISFWRYLYRYYKGLYEYYLTIFRYLKNPEDIAAAIRAAINEYGKFDRTEFISAIKIKELMDELESVFAEIAKYAEDLNLVLNSKYSNTLKWLHGKDNFLLELIVDIAVEWVLTIGFGIILYFIIDSGKNFLLNWKKKLEKEKEELNKPEKISVCSADPRSQYDRLARLDKIDRTLPIIYMYGFFWLVFLILLIWFLYCENYFSKIEDYVNNYLINLIKFLGKRFEIKFLLEYNFRN